MGLTGPGSDSAWAGTKARKPAAKSAKHTHKGKAPVSRLVRAQQQTIALSPINPQDEFQDIASDAMGLASILAVNPDDSRASQKLTELSLRAVRAAEKALSRGDDALFSAYSDLFQRRFADTRTGLETMSERNIGAADYALGVIDLHGLAGERSIDRACRHFASAIDKGFNGARFRHAQCIEEDNPAQALALLRDAADAGHVAANERLGRICLEASPPDAACAQAHLGRASREGRASATALLGWMLAEGLGSSPEPVRAAALYAEAGKRGETSALNNLGELYEKGRGVERNDVAAYEHYLAAARKGFPPGQFNLGRLYAAGRGTGRDLDEARHWLKLAAAAGIDQANRILDTLDAGD